MNISEARHKANEKYNKKAYDEIKVRVSKGKKEVIKTYAAQNGYKGINDLIKQLIDKEMRGG